LRAIGATLFGCALAWGGLLVPPMRPLYDYAWFVGFLAAGALHVALSFTNSWTPDLPSRM